MVGGAAITEEIIPGFKFSRASYLAGKVPAWRSGWSHLADEAGYSRGGRLELCPHPAAYATREWNSSRYIAAPMLS